MGLKIPFLGLDKEHFGQLVVYDVSEYGIYDLNFPIPSITRGSVSVTVNSPRDVVSVDDKDNIYVGKELLVNITSDHRTADGSDAHQVIKKFKEILYNPDRFIS